MKKIHYAGKMTINEERSCKFILAGWAACCSGDKAVKIAADGNNTYNREMVTCKACKALIERERKSHEENQGMAGG